MKGLQHAHFKGSIMERTLVIQPGHKKDVWFIVEVTLYGARNDKPHYYSSKTEKIVKPFYSRQKAVEALNGK